MSTDIDYAYGVLSVLDEVDGVAHLGLATSGGATPDGHVAHPYFLTAFAEYPWVVADALLMVARVARTRFYVPPNLWPRCCEQPTLLSLRPLRGSGSSRSAPVVGCTRDSMWTQMRSTPAISRRASPTST